VFIAQFVKYVNKQGGVNTVYYNTLYIVNFIIIFIYHQVIYDLHLPAMAILTAKRSSQSLFLRILKVILQLRDAAKKIAKKPQKSSSATSSRPRGSYNLLC